MSAVARWREFEGRMPFVRGRLVAAVPAVLGSVLAAATIVWPVLRLSLTTEPSVVESPDYVQQMWSWGRYEVSGVEGAENEVLNVLPAYVLGVACFAGLLGGLLWLGRRGPDGRVLGVAGVSVALAVVGGYSLERLGNSAMFGSVHDAGFTLETLPAGRLEYAASILLVLALLLMLWRPLVALARSLWAFGARVAARGRERAVADEEAELAEEGQAPRVGRAVLREVGSTGGPRSGGERSSDGVGFSDGTSAEDRFHPPI